MMFLNSLEFFYFKITRTRFSSLYILRSSIVFSFAYVYAKKEFLKQKTIDIFQTNFEMFLCEFIQINDNNELFN